MVINAKMLHTHPHTQTHSRFQTLSFQSREQEKNTNNSFINLSLSEIILGISKKNFKFYDQQFLFELVGSILKNFSYIDCGYHSGLKTPEATVFRNPFYPIPMNWYRKSSQRKFSSCVQIFRTVSSDLLEIVEVGKLSSSNHLTD